MVCLLAVALAIPCMLLSFKNRRPDPKWTLLAGLLAAADDRPDGEEGPKTPHSHVR